MNEGCFLEQMETDREYKQFGQQTFTLHTEVKYNVRN